LLSPSACAARRVISIGFADDTCHTIAAAGLTFIPGVPGAEVMLNHQSTSFRDAKQALAFDHWLMRTGLADATLRLADKAQLCLLSNLSDASGVKDWTEVGRPSSEGSQAIATMLWKSSLSFVAHAYLDGDGCLSSRKAGAAEEGE
jgi:hypothetical protein